ncbi:hypothetical protein CsSME_00004052 [Camellia sinensis var. sinensis]
MACLMAKALNLPNIEIEGDKKQVIIFLCQKQVSIGVAGFLLLLLLRATGQRKIGFATMLGSESNLEAQ